MASESAAGSVMPVGGTAVPVDKFNPEGGNGAAEVTRTPDPRITNALLYQLSYSGAVALWRVPDGAEHKRVRPDSQAASHALSAAPCMGKDGKEGLNLM